MGTLRTIRSANPMVNGILDELIADGVSLDSTVEITEDGAVLVYPADSSSEISILDDFANSENEADSDITGDIIDEISGTSEDSVTSSENESSLDGDVSIDNSEPTNTDVTTNTDVANNSSDTTSSTNSSEDANTDSTNNNSENSNVSENTETVSQNTSDTSENPVEPEVITEPIEQDSDYDNSPDSCDNLSNSNNTATSEESINKEIIANLKLPHKFFKDFKIKEDELKSDKFKISKKHNEKLKKALSEIYSVKDDFSKNKLNEKEIKNYGKLDGLELDKDSSKNENEFATYLLYVGWGQYPGNRDYVKAPTYWKGELKAHDIGADCEKEGLGNCSKNPKIDFLDEVKFEKKDKIIAKKASIGLINKLQWKTKTFPHHDGVLLKIIVPLNYPENKPVLKLKISSATNCDEEMIWVKKFTIEDLNESFFELDQFNYKNDKIIYLVQKINSPETETRELAFGKWLPTNAEGQGVFFGNTLNTSLEKTGVVIGIYSNGIFIGGMGDDYKSDPEELIVGIYFNKKVYGKIFNYSTLDSIGLLGGTYNHKENSLLGDFALYLNKKK
jgi:hypothetical protein